MLVYVDDSGDSGQKFDKNSSTHLVMAACIFTDYTQLELLSEAIRLVRDETGFTREFKFSSTRNKVKEKFFEKTWHIRYSVRAISIEKRFLYEEKLRTDGSALKAYAIHRLLGNNFGRIQNAKVFVDGKDTEAFEVPDHAYLMRQVNKRTANSVREVRFIDSKQSIGIQTADMMAGAIQRAVRMDDKQDHRWFNYMKPRTKYPMGTVWDFCKKERLEWERQQALSTMKEGDPTP
ncbi:MAG: DUF3800 domain-containing protein [Micrococcaceae bacterium]|nr:DUF3800 domain-containing protein [Micrococcaceae bacterium]